MKFVWDKMRLPNQTLSYFTFVVIVTWNYEAGLSTLVLDKPKSHMKHEKYLHLYIIITDPIFEEMF